MLIVYIIQTMSELKYRINSVSSEHPRYPAGNLAINQNGWQAAYNPVYPQSITIQFYVPIRTKKLHLIFHQYKIPKLVEVFVKLGGSQKYRKLGYVIPNDNLQSSFEQRQQKTLYFEFSCSHIRLVLHQNYKNDRNIFNQVALEDLIVAGQILPAMQLSGVDLTEQQTSSEQEDVAESMQINQSAIPKIVTSRPNQNQIRNSSLQSQLFREIYQKLELQKKKSIQKQDYQKASHFKSILANFNQLQAQILQLEQQKNEALQKQDYDRCHRIKQLINNKKEVVQFQRNQLFDHADKFYQQNSFVRTAQKSNTHVSNQESKKKSPAKENTFSKKPSPDIKYNPSNMHDEQVVPALLNKGKKAQTFPLDSNQKSRDGASFINQPSIPQLISEGEMTNRKQFNEEVQTQRADVSLDNESFREKLEPLQTKIKLRLQNYFSFIPEQIWQYCECKNWKAKLEAIRYLSAKIFQIQTKEHYLASLQLISRVIVSKQAAVSIEVLQTLLQLTKVNIAFTLQHLPFFVQDIMVQLLSFLSDTNNKIKQLAYRSYQCLPDISLLSLTLVIRQLIKHKNKVKNDPKLIITKLNLMSSVIEKYSEMQYPYKEIINWLLQYFEDPNIKVRNSATQMLVVLACQVGNQKVIKVIENVKPQLMQTVLNMMNSSMEYSKLQIEQSKISLSNSKIQPDLHSFEANKSKATTNKKQKPAVKNQKQIYVLEQSQPFKLQPEKSSRKSLEHANQELQYSKQSMIGNSLQPAGQPEASEQYDGEQQGQCLYCGTFYQDQREHMINQCKLLVFCEKCNGLIYIRQFTDHLLHECDHHSMFKQCKNCVLAFDLTEINDHIAHGTCKKPFGVNWQRCQFCSADVFGQDKYWVKHAFECPSLPPKGQRRDFSYASQHQSLEMSR